uniref:hypothetical protein n=1 Tax=Clostridium sp. NkU-1 TaxID=1095009 RepID=UPI0006D2AC4F
MHTVKGIIKFIVISGLGIVIFIYLVLTKFWMNFSEPLYLNDVTELKTGTIVQFITDIEDTGFTLNYSDGTPSYYFYHGFLDGNKVIIFIHKNYMHQITKASTDQYNVIGKVLKPDQEAVEYFGLNASYVELVREDYKANTLELLLFSLFLTGVGFVIPFFLIQRKK